MASGSAPPPGNLRSFIVGCRRHFAVVTNRADEAAEWVAAVRHLPLVKVRLVGLSFMWGKHSQSGGSGVLWRVESIHFSFLARVLVYFLGQEPFSPAVMEFLRDPENLFVGGGLAAAFDELGVGRRREAAPPRMDLLDVARICGVASMAATAYGMGQLYPALAEAILRDVDLGLLRSPELGRQPWQWPLSDAQIELAVQTAVISQSLSHRAFGRLKILL
ncbi:unnamed protein product [Spirodela intermedia]|uniref:Uncharacterized protein n=1 Tax=Spirodela intermedia TaxID=51605 RepID=A0A7I8J2C8_SPIIN|nr:unnamed protein product [Spirodela intermedia]CAA6663470.1 unnamed protein product [Spirodela intermedia]